MEEIFFVYAAFNNANEIVKSWDKELIDGQGRTTDLQIECKRLGYTLRAVYNNDPAMVSYQAKLLKKTLAEAEVRFPGLIEDFNNYLVKEKN